LMLKTENPGSTGVLCEILWSDYLTDSSGYAPV